MKVDQVVPSAQQRITAHLRRLAAAAEAEAAEMARARQERLARIARSPLTPAERERAYALSEAGWSQLRIAGDIGCSQAAISLLLRAARSCDAGPAD